MTFITQEESIENGAPVELYEFRYAPNDPASNGEWFFTGSDQPYIDTSTSTTYTPISVSRSNIVFSTENTDNPLEIRIQNDISFVDLFRSGSPYEVVSLTIRRVHRTDADDEIIAFWKGRVTNVQWSSGEITLTCESIRSSAKRFGLRRVYQYQCPHVLYGNQCKVDKVDFVFTGTLTAISNLKLTITGLNAEPDGYYTGGYIEYTDGILNTVDRKMITSHVGNVITVISATRNFEVSDPINVYPGCDRSITTCHSKFNNSENYGGFPYTPKKDKNPFGGGMIY